MACVCLCVYTVRGGRGAECLIRAHSRSVRHASYNKQQRFDQIKLGLPLMFLLCLHACHPAGHAHKHSCQSLNLDLQACRTEKKSKRGTTHSGLEQQTSCAVNDWQLSWVLNIYLNNHRKMSFEHFLSSHKNFSNTRVKETWEPCAFMSVISQSNHFPHEVILSSVFKTCLCRAGSFTTVTRCFQ